MHSPHTGTPWAQCCGTGHMQSGARGLQGALCLQRRGRRGRAFSRLSSTQAASSQVRQRRDQRIRWRHESRIWLRSAGGYSTPPNAAAALAAAAGGAMVGRAGRPSRCSPALAASDSALAGSDALAALAGAAGVACAAPAGACAGRSASQGATLAGAEAAASAPAAGAAGAAGRAGQPSSRDSMVDGPGERSSSQPLALASAGRPSTCGPATEGAAPRAPSRSITLSSAKGACLQSTYTLSSAGLHVGGSERQRSRLVMKQTEGPANPAEGAPRVAGALAASVWPRTAVELARLPIWHR